jgi:hypothetical protein
MGRLSYYSPDHGLVGTEPEMQISPLVFLGSELLAATWSGDSVWVVRIQRGTTAAQPLARRVAGFVNPGIPRGRTIRRNARGDSYIAAAVPVFMPRLELAADQDRLFAGNSLSWEIREFTISGRLARIIRLDPDLKITPADIERYRERQLAPYEPAARRVIEQRMRPSDFPETFPAFERLLIDGAGRLWVEDLERTGFKDSGQWMVFDREGRPLGRVALPAGFHVSQIGSDYVLGWWMAPDQFARIRMYELIPAETQPPASPGERERRIR